MKLKLLKKFMIVCMSFSLAVGMLPVSAYATGADEILDLGTPQGEQQMDAPDGPQTETQMPETQTPETERTTEPSVTPGFQAEEETQGDTEPVTDAQEPITEEERSNHMASYQMRSEGGMPSFDGNVQRNDHYTLEDGKYTIKKSLTMIFDEASVSEIEIEKDQTLTLILQGTAMNEIGKITGEGCLIIDKESVGKVEIGSEIASTIKQVTVEAGTILGQTEMSAVACQEVIINGGTVACNISDATLVKSDKGYTKKHVFNIAEKDAICLIHDLKTDGKLDKNYAGKGIWSDGEGKVVLFLKESKNEFQLRAMEFVVEDSGIKAEWQPYSYEGVGSQINKQGSKIDVYSVKVGTELKTVYGERAPEKEMVTVEGEYADKIVISSGSIDGNKMGIKKNEEGVWIVFQKKPNKREDQIPGSYEGTIEATMKDEWGYTHEISGTATLKIDKAILKAQVVKNDKKLDENIKKVKESYEGNETDISSGSVVKIYDGTDKVPGGICSVEIKGAVEGDDVTFDARLGFADVNSKKKVKSKPDQFVYVENKIEIKGAVALDKKWENYYSCETKEDDPVSAQILQKPCNEKPEEIDQDSIELGYDWSAKIQSDQDQSTQDQSKEKHYHTIGFRGVAGQEYSYKTQASQTTEKELKWCKSSDESSCKIKNASAGTKYTLYTRIPETDNYLASESVSTDVTTLRAAHTVQESYVSVSGITDNGTYKLNEKLTLTAKGANPAGKKPLAGDEKYVPYSWKLDKKHEWSKSPYTAKITPTKAGTYKVAVNFRKYIYNGNEWVHVKKKNAKKIVTFTANATGTSSGTSSGGSSSTISGGGSSSTTIKNTTAAKTGDNTPVIPLICVCALSGLAVAVLFFRKKGKK